jgi:type II secretory pathway component GspD/PulD (secretin)
LRSYGGSSVTTSRDPNTARRTVVAAPADLAPLVAVLASHVGPAGAVMPLPRENTVVVTCDKAMKPSVLDVLSKLDIPARQVEISAKIFEVSQDFDYQHGAQLIANRLATDSAQTASSVFSTQRFLDQISQPGNAPFQGGVVSLMKTFKDAGISVDASFQILSDVGLIRVVSSPRMTVACGQTGYMLAGQELPIQTASIVNGVLQIATTYKPVGVQLYITPEAVGPDRVKLHAISIVSSVAGFNPLPKISGNNPEQVLINPVIESREAETAVTIDDGATLVISGLRMSRTTTRENKVPGLGDLPLLGWLFKNHRSQQQLTDLYFFVTPTLL